MIFVRFCTVLLLVRLVHADEVPCSEILPSDYWDFVYHQKSCYLQETNSLNFSVSEDKDETVRGLWLQRKRSFLSLPLKVHEQFPNLVVYGADECSIKTVGKVHFEKLVMLRRLNLRDNQLVEIQNGTFDDLVALEYLELRKNLIAAED
jgi:hypothetical protein